MQTKISVTLSKLNSKKKDVNLFIFNKLTLKKPFLSIFLSKFINPNSG